MKIKKYGHYTSQQGLMGIIPKQKFWATNINFLNDEHEFQHAIRLVKHLIQIANKRFPAESKDRPTYNSFIAGLENELNKLVRDVSEDVFTLSFSAKTDLLSQWRGYCPANNGFCLIFNLDAVFQVIKAQYPNSHVMDCVYKNDKKNEEIKELLNDCWHRYVKSKKDDEKTQMLTALSKEIMLLSSYFKDPSFSEEAEKRIIVILDEKQRSNIQFREGRFSLIPYIELDAPTEHLTAIWLGPTANKELAKRALQMFLRKVIGINVPKVETSTTPYRPW